MANLSHYLTLKGDAHSPEKWLNKEWLVANGLGGYSSSSITCVPTRKYHGLLISSLSGFGRSIMLNHLLEIIILPDKTEIHLGSHEGPEGLFNLENIAFLEEFYLDKGLPVWRYNCRGIVFERRIFLTYLQNTVHVIYTLLSGGDSLDFKLCPYFNFRPISLSVNAPIIQPYVTTIIKNRYEVSSKEFPTVRMFVQGDETGFIFDEHIVKNVYFQKEASRGEVSLGEFWSPGSLTVKLQKNKQVAFLASIENWEDIDSFNSFQALQYEQMRREHLLKKPPEMLRKGFGAELVLAADQFIMVPASRTQDKVRAKATGDQVRTVAAGYHWFADWGRDTMISLEGLTLCTGRFEEARWILRTFAYYVKNGLIPNMFPEGENQGLYHTADASLWFFHALNRYLERVNDQETLEFILPKLLEIYDYHLRGTLFGIRADPIDGLVTQGAEGYQLTWMDAKVDNWVVTPRRGKAVEINALWYNALRLLEKWLGDIKKEEVARQIGELANKVYVSFNQKFWNEKKGCLFDVIEGEKENDDAIRPNQLFSISLEYPVLDPKYWKEVFEVCKRDLLTPVGLRSLSPHHPDYKSRYDGDLRARDSAYHQGTVWSWLIGPYIDVWLKIYPQDSGEAHEFLNGFREHLRDAGVGYISEIFDATEPYQARGCIAQAWSIAELLRCLVKTEPTK